MIFIIIIGAFVGLVLVLAFLANPTIGYTVEVGGITMFFFSKKRAEKCVKKMVELAKDLAVLHAEIEEIKADELCEKINARVGLWDECRVEEFEDGVVFPYSDSKSYWVHFDKNGNVDRYDCSSENLEYCLMKGVLYSEKFGSCSVYLFADSDEEALKIASEKRAKYIAEHTGVV